MSRFRVAGQGQGLLMPRDTRNEKPLEQIRVAHLAFTANNESLDRQ
jgi:hypothetical protein